MKTPLETHKTLIPEYMKNLETYKAGKSIDELIREKNLTRISKLASNENPLGPSPLAVKEMTLTLWDVHRYPDMYGNRLKTALAQHHKLTLDNIILGNGSEGIMADIMRTFVRPGDEILTCEHTFIGLTVLARGAGSQLIQVPLTSDYRFNVPALIKAITENTKVVYICNPNNPTGTYIDRSEFDTLMKAIPEHCLVILDEAYFEYARHQKDYPDSMDYRYDNVITLRTFSKAYGIAGVRVGYGFAHDFLITNLNKVRLPFGPNILGQVAAYGALQDLAHLNANLRNNQERYQETWDFLNKHQFSPIPSATNFIAFPTPSEEAAMWLYQELLNYGVIIRPLKSNDMPAYLRVSLGTKEEMQHFFTSMEDLLPRYSKVYRS